jgi:hypothetical protein
MNASKVPGKSKRQMDKLYAKFLRNKYKTRLRYFGERLPELLIEAEKWEKSR